MIIRIKKSVFYPTLAGIIVLLPFLWVLYKNYGEYGTKPFSYWRYQVIPIGVSKSFVETLMGIDPYPTKDMDKYSPYPYHECWGYPEHEQWEYRELQFCFDKKGILVKKSVRWQMAVK